MIAAQARAAILAAPFALIVAYRARLRRPLAALAVAAIVVASGFIVVAAFERSHMSVSRDLSPEFLVANQLESPDRGGGRLIPLQRLPGLFGATPLGWVAGLGPGQYGSAFRQIPSMLAYAYSVANSEWTVIWGEYGLTGLLCLAAILARPLLDLDSARDLEGRDWTRQMARAAPSIVLAGVVGMTVLTILEYQPFSYPLWALLGLVEGAYFVRRKEQR